MKWYLIKLDINGNPYERSQSFDEEPTLEDGWDEVWTQDNWDNYVASIPPPPEPVYPETATQVSDFYDMTIDNYDSFRTHLLAIVEALGNGDESVGFDNLNATEREFVALNGIGSKTQIDSVLDEPTKRTIEFLILKQVLK